MDIWQVLRITLRRWYIAAPILALGVVASYVAADRVAIEYTSGASVLLVSPEALGTPEPEPSAVADPDTTLTPPDSALESTGNPWLSFSGSLNTAAQAIQLSVLSQETARVIEDEGLSPDYSVGTDRRSPIILIETTSSDPELTQRTLERLVTLVEEDLSRRQVAAGAPASRQIHAEILSMDDTPERAVAARLRVRLGILVLGVIAAMLAAVAFDSLVRIARRRRPDRVGPTPDDVHGDDDRSPVTVDDSPVDQEPRSVEEPLEKPDDGDDRQEREERPAARALLEVVERHFEFADEEEDEDEEEDASSPVAGASGVVDTVAIGSSANHSRVQQQGFAVWSSRSPSGQRLAL